ncbi:hypothetical protein OKW33_005025 [Paraburkholderia atlantica]|uniref:Uncharacterized protein n=1 Tax=Paraburkholderia atlantica TaxID=2654982 RepID=A0A7W8VB28_PARAM|nr:hypothetical protein [Paraburkholderia atlantica]
MQDLGPSVATTLRDISRRTVDWLAFGNPLAINGHQYRVIGARRAGEQEFEFVKCQTGKTSRHSTSSHPMHSPTVRFDSPVRSAYRD